jgi:hypothetical protein
VQFPRWSLPALLVLTLSPVWGQSKPVAVLHRRVSPVNDEFDYATRSVGRTALPPEASGEYVLGGGGTIEIDLQPDRLSGFITRQGDRESDEGTPLTFFFATSRLSSQQLAFTTRQVHGVSWAFQGTIVRGSARTRDQQGYYLLQGQLVMRDAAGQTEQARMVSLPLARQNPNG